MRDPGKQPARNEHRDDWKQILRKRQNEEWAGERKYTYRNTQGVDHPKALMRFQQAAQSSIADNHRNRQSKQIEGSQRVVYQFRWIMQRRIDQTGREQLHNH